MLRQYFRRLLGPATVLVFVLLHSEHAGVAEPEPAQSPNLIRTWETDACAWEAVFSPDGKMLVAGTGKEIIMWDSATGRKIHSFNVDDGGATNLVLTSDGKSAVTTAAAGAKEFVVRLWSLETGKEIRRFNGHTDKVFDIACTRNGKLLASGSDDCTVRLWDIGTGEELACLKGHTKGAPRVAFCPGDLLLASGGFDCTVRLWDMEQRKEIRKLELGENVNEVTFSSDGALLAALGASRLIVWETATGRVVREFPQDYGHCVAFSPDGAFLVGGGCDRDVHIWELASGQEVARFAGHTNTVHSIHFGPDSCTFATASKDNSVRVWSVTGAKADGKPRELADDQLESLWRELACPRATTAFKAVGSLCAAPKQTIPFLRNVLKPEPRREVTNEQMLRWIGELDDDEFAVRDRAMTELGLCTEQARALMCKALEKPKSLEMQRRLEELVDRLDGRALPAHRLQALRGLNVLERLATPEAVDVIEHLAEGREDAWLTDQASKALKRLKNWMVGRS